MYRNFLHVKISVFAKQRQTAGPVIKQCIQVKRIQPGCNKQCQKDNVQAFIQNSRGSVRSSYRHAGNNKTHAVGSRYVKDFFTF